MSAHQSPMINRGAFKEFPGRPQGPSRLPKIVHRILFGFFLVQFALVLVRLWMPPSCSGDARWPDAMLGHSGGCHPAGVALRQLPSQNVMLAASSSRSSPGCRNGWGAHGHSVRTICLYRQHRPPALLSTPLGRAHHMDHRGFQFARVARIMLRPWRKTRCLWLLAHGRDHRAGRGARFGFRSLREPCETLLVMESH